MLPAEATVVVGQPLDDRRLSRARRTRGCSGSSCKSCRGTSRATRPASSTSATARGTESLRERYADRIQARIARHVPNLESSILRRVVLSPADLQAANINLEHGDPYSGLTRARPELSLAAVRPPTRAPHADRRSLPDRCEHVARTRARCRLRHARREGASAAACRRSGSSGGSARFCGPAGIESPACGHVSRSRRSRRWRRRSRRTSAPTPPPESTESASGRSSFRRRRRRGARAARGERARLGRPRSPRCRRSCRCRLMDGPADPQRANRRDLRLAAPARAFEPSSVVCLTGPGDDRDTVVEGLQTIGEEAARARCAHRARADQPHRRGGLDDDLVASGGGRAARRRRSARARHPVRQLARLEHARARRRTSSGMPIASSASTSPTGASPTRGWCDRVLPGDGVADLPAILGTLDRAGWDGFYDLEIFSDNGTFGNAWPGFVVGRSGRGAGSAGEGRVRACVGGTNPNVRLTRYRPVPCNRPMRTTPRGGN